MNLAPICLFTYNRLNETKKTILALQDNFLASQSDLFIFSDGPQKTSHSNEIIKVREFLKRISGFKSVTVFEGQENFGLAKSIITGVTQIIKTHSRVIVLEDDLITSKNFLNYMNDALNFYQNLEQIWSVSGFSFPIKAPSNYLFDNYFGLRSTSWGWGTWQNRWEKVDWEVEDYNDFTNNQKAKKLFNMGGSDMCKMLNDQMTGKINSWAIRFCYSQFKNESYDIYPVISKVVNVGFTDLATHTGGMGNRFYTQLDKSNQVKFNFNHDIKIDPSILKQFRKPFSLKTRLLYKVKRLLK